MIDEDYDSLDDPRRTVRICAERELLLTGRGALPYRFDPPGHRESFLGPLPRVVHMLWLDEPLPARYRVLHDELRAHNPEWHVHVWNRSSAIPMRNRDLFDAETNPGAKSDIARYEVVRTYGGTYLDVDFKSHGPGSLTEAMRSAWTTVSGPPWYNCNNAQFGFAAGSEFLAYVIEALRDPRVRAESCSTRRMGPTFFTTCLLSFGDMRLVAERGADVVGKLTHLAHANWVGK